MRTALITMLALILFPATPGQSARTVSDPYDSEFFSCVGQPDGRLFNDSSEHGYNGFRMIADLNFDGREDLILSKSDQTGGTGCGNSGCSVVIFLLQADKTYRSLEFGLHPLATALSRIATGEGQLVTYGHVSASEGVLAFDKVSADSITRMRMQTVHANDSKADDALYSSWFSGNMALHAQYSWCSNGKLEWSDRFQ